jgi:hypothetical protein
MPGLLASNNASKRLFATLVTSKSQFGDTLLFLQNARGVADFAPSYQLASTCIFVSGSVHFVAACLLESSFEVLGNEGHLLSSNNSGSFLLASRMVL